MGWRTGTDWRREELKEERGWAQGIWGKDHQKEERPEEKREEPVEAGLMGGSGEGAELQLGKLLREEPLKGGVAIDAGGGATEMGGGLAREHEERAREGAWPRELGGGGGA